MPITKLNEKQISYIIREMKKGTKPSTIAQRMKISSRRVYQIYGHYVQTGSAPKHKKIGRPKKEPTEKEIQMVIETYDAYPQGAIRITKQLQSNHIQISRNTVKKIMSREGLSYPSSVKKQCTWIRYERKYSNAMWHVDWHMIKDPRWRNLWLICYLDDASRCITGFGVYQHATAENTILTLDSAIEIFGAPAQILSDHGTQFTSNREPKKGNKKPTLFEKELHNREITHLLARVNHPQTNGKIERFFGTFERDIVHFARVDEYIGFYNEKRLHFALDMDNAETPLMAFRSKQASAEIRANPKWANEDAIL